MGCINVVRVHRFRDVTSVAINIIYDMCFGSNPLSVGVICDLLLVVTCLTLWSFLFEIVVPPCFLYISFICTNILQAYFKTARFKKIHVWCMLLN